MRLIKIYILVLNSCVMKTIAFFLMFVISGSVFSQNKKQEEESLKYVKNFYDKLERIKLDASKELLWKYTYSDTSLTTLTKLSKVLEKEQLKVMYLDKSKTEKGVYELTVFEKKIYKNAKLLNERVMYLNSVAKILNIEGDEATLGASKPDKTEYIGDYQPVQKNKKAD